MLGLGSARQRAKGAEAALSARVVASAQTSFSPIARFSTRFHEQKARANEITPALPAIARIVILGKRSASVCWTGKA